MAQYQNFYSHLKNSILDANKTGQMPGTKNNVIDGFSGESLVGCLQRFARYFSGKDNTCYLEIGIYQGLTLLSTSLANPDIACFGVDNFVLFNEGKENYRIVLERKERLGISNAHILNMDFEEALDNLDKHLGHHRIGVLFIDGAHDYRSQLVSLLKARRYLANESVIIIDDSNYAHVRQANADFLASDRDFALFFEAYTLAHPANMDADAKEKALKGWWNGVNILVYDPQQLLPRSFPYTGSKERFFCSHDVFRHEFAEVAIDALRHCSFLIDGDAPSEQEARAKLRKALKEHRIKHSGRFPFQNTESYGLPGFKLHV